MSHSLPSSSVFTAISTPRLVLRPYGPELAFSFWKLINRERERLLPDFPERTTAVIALKDAERYLRKLVYQWNEDALYSFAILLKPDHRYIGDMTLRRLTPGKPYAEVGYYVATSAEGQGFITEALKAVLQIAFLELQMETVNLRCGAENARSQRIAARCGFTRLKTTALSFTDSKQTKGRPIFTFRIKQDDDTARLFWQTF